MKILTKLREEEPKIGNEEEKKAKPQVQHLPYPVIQLKKTRKDNIQGFFIFSNNYTYTYHFQKPLNKCPHMQNS